MDDWHKRWEKGEMTKPDHWPGFGEAVRAMSKAEHARAHMPTLAGDALETVPISPDQEARKRIAEDAARLSDPLRYVPDAVLMAEAVRRGMVARYSVRAPYVTRHEGEQGFDEHVRGGALDKLAQGLWFGGGFVHERTDNRTEHQTADRHLTVAVVPLPYWPEDWRA
jgi:hypothetical protein